MSKANKPLARFATNTWEKQTASAIVHGFWGLSDVNA
jgi:hypothetical protein